MHETIVITRFRRGRHGAAGGVCALALLLPLGTANAEPTKDERPASDGGPARIEPTSSQRKKLELFASAGYIGSPGTNGTALTYGLRLGVSQHFAASLDVGYGLVAAAGSAVQDRWWIIPSALFVLPTRLVRFDAGVGVGLGASSGFTSFSTFAREPFNPSWAFQLFPAVRLHTTASLHVARDLDLFARADGASLLLGGPSVSGPHSGLNELTWATLSLGVSVPLL